eukprot:TRINITY_DN2682_c0_g1_i5.p1 TRINITY_DN2682_c0_g1~~TRINITY_DN2682_c0_g1_i5.p1  ORF type:complete len:245 (-),score=47.46 TRINITY_DN2682_c0_g1_i5:579-1313(-)
MQQPVSHVTSTLEDRFLTPCNVSWFLLGTTIVLGTTFAIYLRFSRSRLEKYGLRNREELVLRLSSPSFVSNLLESSHEKELLVTQLMIVVPDPARLMVVEQLIVREVESTDTFTTLFRTNALVTKAMSKISSLVGREYLKHILSDLIKHMYRNTCSFSYLVQLFRLKSLLCGFDGVHVCGTLKKKNPLFLFFSFRFREGCQEHLERFQDFSVFFFEIFRIGASDSVPNPSHVSFTLPGIDEKIS